VNDGDKEIGENSESIWWWKPRQLRPYVVIEAEAVLARWNIVRYSSAAAQSQQSRLFAAVDEDGRV